MRVTEVIDYFAEPYLVEWKLKNKEWKKVSEEALRVGGIVDRLIQDDLNGVAVDMEKFREDAPTFTALNNWFLFKEENTAIVDKMIQYKDNMQLELRQGDLVGHPDFILGNEVIDLKTSKQVSKSHWIQTAQYALMTGKPIVRISVLRVDKINEGVYQYVSLEEPFITFWQGKFRARLEAFLEESEFREMMRKKLEKERLA